MGWAPSRGDRAHGGRSTRSTGAGGRHGGMAPAGATAHMRHELGATALESSRLGPLGGSAAKRVQPQGLVVFWQVPPHVDGISS
eukprot:scaffold22784_cov34-Tisochrysis_lutea.AAC.4